MLSLIVASHRQHSNNKNNVVNYCYSSNTENPYAADVSRRVITKADSHMQISNTVVETINDNGGRVNH